MLRLRTIFLSFFRIGLFTFGGGYAMISIIENNCVERKKWITHDDMMNITVIAESTPGPIAINCATFVGYEQAGLLGAAAATIGIILPSFGVIYGISMFLDNFLEITWIANAFKGIKIAVGILILDVAVTMIKKMPQKTLPRVIMLASFASMFLINVFHLRFSSIGLMAAAAVVSTAVFAMKGGTGEKGGSGRAEASRGKGGEGK